MLIGRLIWYRRLFAEVLLVFTDIWMSGNPFDVPVFIDALAPPLRVFLPHDAVLFQYCVPILFPCNTPGATMSAGFMVIGLLYRPESDAGKTDVSFMVAPDW